MMTNGVVKDKDAKCFSAGWWRTALYKNKDAKCFSVGWWRLML
jgi:hypothetical protein